MRHYVDLSIVPFDEFSILPDLGSDLHRAYIFACHRLSPPIVVARSHTIKVRNKKSFSKTRVALLGVMVKRELYRTHFSHAIKKAGLAGPPRKRHFCYVRGSA